METVNVVNLGLGKNNKKVGVGVYNFEIRSNLPKMPKMSKKRDQFLLPSTASASTLTYSLCEKIEVRKAEQAESLEKSKQDRQSLLSFGRSPITKTTPNSKITTSGGDSGQLAQ